MCRILYCFLLVFLVSCDYGPRNNIEVADIYKVYNQDKAMFLAEGRFEDKYRVISDAFDRAEVFWTDTWCPYEDTIAVIVDGVCYRGIMWDCGSMYVALSVKDMNRTCPTALIHEFGHCLLMDAGWDADGLHKDLDFWNFMTEVRHETCDRDW